MALISIIAKSAAGLAAAAGLAFAGVEGVYDGKSANEISRSDATSHAVSVFARSDRNGDGALSADEFVALSVVTAELAYLNGFIVIEKGEDIATAPLAGPSRAALTRFEQTRLEAVARNRFYANAGADGKMNAAEFVRLQMETFNASDINGDGVLKRRELGAFAMRQATEPIGA